ncbi:MAG: ATP-dependent Clp protease proteolytic subunit [Planctomycetota bacterium]|nr:ATP-dependent Clp protease proteolytic subunit [Planctomycetota bacterium]
MPARDCCSHVALSPEALKAPCARARRGLSLRPSLMWCAAVAIAVAMGGYALLPVAAAPATAPAAVPASVAAPAPAPAVTPAKPAAPAAVPPSPGPAAPAAPAPATAAATPTYMIIPIRGAIGWEFSSMLMKAYLETAAKLKPAVIILDIDTPGGEVGEAEEIVNLMTAAKEQRFVALVRKALSAGAMITMACKEIYVTEGATIGAAVSYRVGRDGQPMRMPADVAEKYQSAWRAVCRKAAEHGGHPTILAEAMIDPAFSLTLRHDGDKVVVERDGTGDVLKANGRVLTLTAREAVSCGLARGIVDDLAALGPRLGLTGWQLLETSRGRVRGSAEPAPIEQAPTTFFDVLAKKMATLNMSEEKTDLQKKEAGKEWTAWLEQEKIVGRRIQWTLSMVEASETAANGVLTTLKSKVTEGKGILAKNAEAVRKNPSIRPQVEAEAKRVQTVITQISAEIKRIESSPVWVAASSPDEPRLIVSAWFPTPYTEALARVSPKAPLTLTGSILAVKRYSTKDGITLLMAILDQCALPGAASSPAAVAAAGQGAAPAPAGSEAEQAARNKLNLVRAFRRNGFPDKAEAVLKQLLVDYPNTSVVEEAKRQLKEVQEEPK